MTTAHTREERTMTAHERIWADDSGIWYSDDQGEPEEYTEYTRTDLSSALIAAAYNTCADLAAHYAESYEQGSDGRNTFTILSNLLCAKTPDDAIAAYDKAIASAREEGIREAIAKADELYEAVKGSDATGVERLIAEVTLENVEKELLALLEKEPTDE